jgi:ribulose-phosphate 3-epimerase
MAEIIPSINVTDFAHLEERIRIAEKSAGWVHIDVTDGTFTKVVLWHNAQELQDFKSSAKIEVHLMIANPEEKLSEWLMPNISRIIFHAEAAIDADGIIERTHKAHIESGIAICRGTSPDVLLPFIGKADLFQTLAVTPGPSGQEFDPMIIEKIKRLHAMAPRIPIEVDGGIKVGIAKECVHAGATFLTAEHALFNDTGTFEENMKKLSHDITA